MSATALCLLGLLAFGHLGPGSGSGARAWKVESFDPDAYEKSRPALTGQDGVTAGGARWIDRKGKNVLALVWQVEDGNKRLWAFHYIDGDKPRLVRKVQDKEENCEFDNMAGFVAGSVGATDLDGDGIGEVTFAYDLGCVSDVSPTPRKLLLLEDGQKWILRGLARAADGAGGTFKPDPAKGRWPAAFHRHATARWAELLARAPGQ
jgi:hypothetical protein